MVFIFQDVLNHSDHKAILKLVNLVEGVYTFELNVEDNRGLKSTDKVVLSVKQGMDPRCIYFHQSSSIVIIICQEYLSSITDINIIINHYHQNRHQSLTIIINRYYHLSGIFVIMSSIINIDIIYH